MADLRFGPRFNTQSQFGNHPLDDRLLGIMNDAAQQYTDQNGGTVTAISGTRPMNPLHPTTNHPLGRAIDVSITDANGNRLGNYQDPKSFNAYEGLAQTARTIQQTAFPELNNNMRWGGYFSGVPGQYGAMDTMHMDLSGSPSLGMAGGTWDNGLNNAERAIMPGIQSTGMLDNPGLTHRVAGVTVANANLGRLIPDSEDAQQVAGISFANPQGRFSIGPNVAPTPPSTLNNIASVVTAPFNAAQNALTSAYGAMFGTGPSAAPTAPDEDGVSSTATRWPRTLTPQAIAALPSQAPTPPANVGTVAPTPQRPASYAPLGTGPAGPLSTAPVSGTVTASALPTAPTRMPTRPVSQTPLIVGTQVADTPPAPAPSYAEGTLGHLLSRPQSAVMGSLAPSMPMIRTTAMPPSTPSSPITAPTAQQAVDLSNRMKAMDAADLASRTASLKTALQTTPSSITAPAAFSMPSRPISPTLTAFAPTAPQTAPTVPQSPQQQTGQWVSDLKAMDAAEGARRMAALSMPVQPVSPPQTAPVAPTPSLQAPSLSPSVPSVASASAPTPTPSLPSLSPSAPAINGQTTTGLFASNAGLPGLSAMMQGNRPTLTPENFAASLQPPTVPGTNLPAGDPASPVNGPPVGPPSTLSKITPTLGDIKTGLVGAKIGMGAGPIGAAAGFAIPVLGGIANRLGYGLNSPFFGGPTPNPGASPATQADVVAHAAPSVLAQVNRMGYGALPAGSDYHYGYSPFGSGISLVSNNDTEAHQIAATGPGLLGALGFGGPASAPSIAAQAAAAHLAAANDAANSAAVAQGSVNQGNGGTVGDNGSNGGKNGRGRNKNDNSGNNN